MIELLMHHELNFHRRFIIWQHFIHSKGQLSTAEHFGQTRPGSWPDTRSTRPRSFNRPAHGWKRDLSRCELAALALHACTRLHEPACPHACRVYAHGRTPARDFRPAGGVRARVSASARPPHACTQSHACTRLQARQRRAVTRERARTPARARTRLHMRAEEHAIRWSKNGDSRIEGLVTA